MAQSTWTGDSGDGQWGTGGNWTPNGEPSGDAIINIGATITLPGTPTNMGNLNITTGSITLNANSSTFTADLINVDGSGTLNLNVASGAIVNASNMSASTVSGDGGGNGAFNLTGGGTLNLGTSGDNASAVGLGGNGTFTQGGSTTVNVTAGLFIGADGNVSNPSSLPSGSNTAAGGTGTYTLNSGTLIADDLLMGTGSGLGGGNSTGGSSATSGTLTINGGTLTTQYMEIGLGENPGGTVSQVSNVAGMVNQNNGTVTIGELFAGETQGATGTYNMNNGSLGVTGLTVGDNSGASGTFQQIGGTVTTSGDGEGVFVGEGGTGAYNISGGNLIVDAADYLIVGDQSGSNGTMTQSGSTVTVNGTFIVGNSGTGKYTLSSGILNVNSQLEIGENGGAGNFTYQGGALNLTQGVYIGATSAFNQNASITLTDPVAQAIYIDTGGAYNLNAGTLITGGNNPLNEVFTGTGNFNFAGGTAQVSSAWTDFFNGNISNNSTINTTSGNVILSGNLTGNGTLTLTGGGDVALTGTNNSSGSSWGLQITNATVNVSSVASLSQTGTFTIGSGSFLNLSSSGNATDTFAGSIAGAGTFNTGANDTADNTLILSGTTNLGSASATNIGNGFFGTLEVAQGTISNVNGTNASPSNTFIVGGSGSGGTVSLLGNGTNILPMVTVDPGYTLLAQSITGTVMSTGSLGTLGSFNTPATLAISGGLTSSGTMLINVNGLAADQFQAATATLSGLVQVKGVGLNTYNIVSTTGGITIGGDGNLNDPLGLTTNPPSALFSTTLSENAGDTELLLTTNQKTLAEFAQTPNELAVAGALDPFLLASQTNPAFASLGATLNTLTAPELPVALEELSPESLQYARDIAFENSTFEVQNVDNALANVRRGYSGIDTSGLSIVDTSLDSNLGRSMNSLLADNDGPWHRGRSGTDGADDRTMSDSPEALSHMRSPNFTEFINGDVVLANLNRDQGAENAPSSKASYTGADAAAGVAFRMTSNLSAGVLFDYNHTDAKTDSSGSKTEVDSYSPGIYGTYFNHGFYANGLFSFGYNEYSNTRNVAFLGSTASSSPTGEQYVTNLDAGYDFQPKPEWIVGPLAGLTYTHLDIDSFTETGAPSANLTVDSQSADSLRSRLGGHVMYQAHTGSLLFQPNLNVMWQHEYLDSSSGITSSFTDFASNPFTIQTAAPSRDSALVSLGLNATLDNAMTFSLNYLADAGAADLFAQSVVGTFKARF